MCAMSTLAVIGGSLIFGFDAINPGLMNQTKVKWDTLKGVFIY